MPQLAQKVRIDLVQSGAKAEKQLASRSSGERSVSSIQYIVAAKMTRRASGVVETCCSLTGRVVQVTAPRHVVAVHACPTKNEQATLKFVRVRLLVVLLNPSITSSSHGESLVFQLSTIQAAVH